MSRPKPAAPSAARRAEPYLDRLLRLPPFLIGHDDPTTRATSPTPSRLTGHFLDMHVWLPRQLEPPAIRETFIGAGVGPAD